MLSKEGFLHLDVSAGCTAHGLIAALEQLPCSPNALPAEPLLEAQYKRLQDLLSQASDTLTDEQQETALTFLKLLNRLNPAYVTASTLVIAAASPVQQALSTGILTQETDNPLIITDDLGIALVVSIAASFGPRPLSTLLHMATGTQHVRALWCLPASIPSLPTATSSAGQHTSLLKLEAYLGHSIDESALCHALTQAECVDISITHLFTKGQQRPFLRALLPSSALKTCLETVYTLGRAEQITTHAVEHYALIEREVAVPFLQGQQTQQCRLTVYCLGTQVLRVKPNELDIARLSEHFGFAPEAIRQDVIKAYKRLSSKNAVTF